MDEQYDVVVCSMPLCPSRLALPQPMTRAQANALARAMRWRVGGGSSDRHTCLTCATASVERG